MTGVICVCVAVLTALGTPGFARAAEKAATTAAAAQVRIPDLGIAFVVPAGYESAEELPEGIAGRYVRSEASSSDIALAVRSGWSGAMDATQAEKVARVILEGAPNFRVEQTEVTTIAGERGILLTGTTGPKDSNASPTSQRACHLAVAHQGRLYVFTLNGEATQWSEILSAVRKLRETIQWVK